MQNTRAHDQPQNSQLEMNMSLREHLLAAGSTAQGSAPSPYPPSATPTGPYPPHPESSTHDHNIDPHVTGEALPYPMGGETDDNMSPDARKGKRELSTSKRAAQNRAAQRAFRQRKEGYIKKLEEQVKEFQDMEQNFKALQNENYQLREYILNLQARLLENQSDFPPAPSHINLSSSQSSAAPPPPGSSAGPSGGAEQSGGPYGPEQQLRREMQQQHPPPPAPVTAREDPPAGRHDGLTQLHAAAAASGDEQHRPSPYPPPAEYPPLKRARADDGPEREGKPAV